MVKHSDTRSISWLILAAVAAAVIAPSFALAAVPVVKTVPWVAGNPLVPHFVLSGQATTLKGTSDLSGAGITYSWNPGDGNPPIAGNVTNGFVVEATHTYAPVAPLPQFFTAVLTVTDTGNGDSASTPYRVVVVDPSLEAEVNIAIDDGLWYLHKNMQRTATDGHWLNGSVASSGFYSVSASNILAFEVSGHLESGDPSNPYTETMSRALLRLFTWLSAVGIPANQVNPVGAFNPDSNGNTLGVRVNQNTELYQGGMLMDAIVASATPGAVTTTGPANIVGRTYFDIIQDMVDYYAYCQYDGAQGGGWRYSCNQFPDGSANQWAAIGLIAAEQDFGAIVPQIVKDANEIWVNFSHAATGICGYTSTNPVWGPYAVTPSCTVQMVMDDIGRGDALWDTSEGFLRANFGNGGGATTSIKNYYYGLFSFTKSMLLHTVSGTCVANVCNGGGKAGEGCTVNAQCGAPIDLLGGDYDWYGAEVTGGAFTDGVARTLVGDQNAAGYWTAHNFSSSQYPFETGWAIVMLRKTVIRPPPVCLVSAVPNPAEANQLITLDCSGSFHTDPDRSIVSWDWDLDDDGAFDDASGPTTSTSFPLPLGTHTVSCLVTDGGDDNGEFILTDDCEVDVDVTIPPIAPTAEAGGPYLLCSDRQPWFLDGTGSVNPDDGQNDAGAPPDFITSYDWELDGVAPPDASGSQPDVTAFFTGAGIPGDHLVTLTVCDNTALSFPASGLGDLCDTDSAEVRVRDAAAAECQDCTVALTAVTAGGGLLEVQLDWTAQAGAASYNVYRSTTQGGPYVLLTSTAGLSYLDTAFECPADGSPIPTHYYIVRAAALDTKEFCQSNEADGMPTCCENLSPKSQGFWRRVCKKAHPDQPDRSILTPELCEDMNPDPHSDPCERARSQFGAVLYNVISDRLDAVCTVDATGDDVATTIAEIDALITLGTNQSCKEASSLAAGINEGGVSQ